MKTESLHIKISREQQKAIREAAYLNEVSAAEVVRRALNKYLKIKEPVTEPSKA